MQILKSTFVILNHQCSVGATNTYMFQLLLSPTLSKAYPSIDSQEINTYQEINAGLRSLFHEFSTGYENISMKIPENLDPRKFSTIQY